MSRPAWGAWIEMSSPPLDSRPLLKSRPAWGAWIEIKGSGKSLYMSRGRAPHGARGLK